MLLKNLQSTILIGREFLIMHKIINPTLSCYLCFFKSPTIIILIVVFGKTKSSFITVKNELCENNIYGVRDLSGMG